MFEEVRKHCPGISAWIEICYHDEPNLFFAYNLLSSSCGVQQGDPLGPLLFTLILHPLVLKRKL